MGEGSAPARSSSDRAMLVSAGRPVGSQGPNATGLATSASRARSPGTNSGSH
jgi:hypothetical protein